jgi:hypothetical protein
MHSLGSDGGKFCLNQAAVSWRDVDGDIVALDVASGAYFTINGSGRVLWTALVESASADDLTELLISTFGIAEEQARVDATAFLEDLSSRSLIEPA